MFKTALLAGALTVCFGTAAAALCSNPPINNGDTVFKFRSTAGGASSSEAAIGRRSKISARQPGTLYYDHVKGALMLCTGSNWVPAGGDLGIEPYVQGTFAKWAVWRKTYTPTTAHPRHVAPLVDTGTYKVIFNVEESNQQCDFFLHDSGNVKRGFVTKGDTGGDRWMQTSFTFYGRDSRTYSFTMDGYGTDEANNGGTTNMNMAAGREQGSLTWNGRISLEPGSCKGFVSIMRIQ